MKIERLGTSAGALALLCLSFVVAACRSSGCKQLDDLVGVQPEEDGETVEAASERGLYDCSCDYLTDTDLSGQERVRVCAEDPQEAKKRASGCAQLHSPGMVSSCSCVLFGKYDCAENDCRQNR